MVSAKSQIFSIEAMLQYLTAVNKMMKIDPETWNKIQKFQLLSNLVQIQDNLYWLSLAKYKNPKKSLAA